MSVFTATSVDPSDGTIETIERVSVPSCDPESSSDPVSLKHPVVKKEKQMLNSTSMKIE